MVWVWMKCWLVRGCIAFSCPQRIHLSTAVYLLKDSVLLVIYFQLKIFKRALLVRELIIHCISFGKTPGMFDAALCRDLSLTIASIPPCKTKKKYTHWSLCTIMKNSMFIFTPTKPFSLELLFGVFFNMGLAVLGLLWILMASWILIPA